MTTHTHAELVAKVEEVRNETDQWCLDGHHPRACRCSFARKSHLDDLLAILNLHTPMRGDLAGVCQECGRNCPCRTVGVVVDALQKMGAL